jgi:O-antigen ligase
MLTNPLTGVGLGQHGLAFLKQTGHWQWSGVHNVYLEIGADLGIVSLVVYLLAVWHLLKDLSRSLDNLRALPDTGVLLALGTGIRTALIAFLVAAFFHPVAYHFYFFYIAGFAVAFGELARRRAGLTLRAVPA